MFDSRSSISEMNEDWGRKICQESTLFSGLCMSRSGSNGASAEAAAHAFQFGLLNLVFQKTE